MLKLLKALFAKIKALFISEVVAIDAPVIKLEDAIKVKADVVVEEVKKDL